MKECRVALEEGTEGECRGCALGTGCHGDSVHLRIFARLGLRRAACGAALEEGEGTEDAARVTCQDCAGRVVREER